jgi:hypothetical protein
MNVPDAALEYARRGWALFPCAFGTKTPLTKHGLHDATIDLDQIARWWRRTPSPNIALLTGQAFDVVDLDTPGAREWARGQGWNIGPGVETGRGLHVYVQATGSGNRTALRPGIDYRGRGGYVIAPPSVHPTGHRYRWNGSPVRDSIPPAPDWLQQLLAARNSGTARIVARNSGTARIVDATDRFASTRTRGATRATTPRGIASLRAMAARLANESAGNRNALLFWSACTAADTGIAQDDVAAVLRDAARRAGLDLREIERTLRSAFVRWT